jgi:hypothetical protein
MKHFLASFSDPSSFLLLSSAWDSQLLSLSSFTLFPQINTFCSSKDTSALDILIPFTYNTPTSPADGRQTKQSINIISEHVRPFRQLSNNVTLFHPHPPLHSSPPPPSSPFSPPLLPTQLSHAAK